MNGKKARMLRAAALRVKLQFYPSHPAGMTRSIYKHMKKRYNAILRGDTVVRTAD